MSDNYAQLRRSLGEQFAGLATMTNVTDIVVNGASSVWVDKGHGLLSVLSPFHSDEEVRCQAIRLAAQARKRLDDASPIADGVIEDIRFHAILPPLVDAPTVSLRVFARRRLKFADLVASGSIAPRMEEILRKLVKSRWNCLISGATGAGKTTVLGALLGLVEHNQRIICIEEVTELWPKHPHVVHLRERACNIQGKGRIDMTELVRAAMRMRPDRIVLGECRGPEIADVLAAMNTGHDGCWATLHANSAEDVPARVWALGALAGMSAEAVTAQAISGVQAVLHIQRAAGCRWVQSVGVPVAEAGNWKVLPALNATANGCEATGPGWKILHCRLNEGSY